MGEMVDEEVIQTATWADTDNGGLRMPIVDVVDDVADNNDESWHRPDGARGGKSTTGWAVPLWLARRTACLNVLRREGVRSCVEFGCGSGSVLSVCTAPAWSADDFPGLYPPPLDSEEDERGPPLKKAKMDTLRRVPRTDPEKSELHMRRLVGVDVRPESLRAAIELTAPPEATADDDLVARERWEELVVELWEGGMETYNEVFDGVDAIIVTEVIEHISDKALEKAEQLLLGVYNPRVMVVTTPNYSFNPYFPDSPAPNEHRVPDPTGRTKRIFRNADHQFEFTPDEFRKWAKTLARENDYTVSFSGVGSLAEFYSPDELPATPPSLHHHPELAATAPGDPSQFFATQIAIFRRQLSYQAERSPRSHRMQPLPFMTPVTAATADATATITANGVVDDEKIKRPSDMPYNARRLGPTDERERPSPPFRRRSLYPMPHILRKTHVHPVHPSALSPPHAPAEILGMCRGYLEANGRAEASLAELWTVGAVRRACAGQTSALVDAALEDDDWHFALAADKNATSMDALVLSSVSMTTTSNVEVAVAITEA